MPESPWKAAWLGKKAGSGGPCGGLGFLGASFPWILLAERSVVGGPQGHVHTEIPPPHGTSVGNQLLMVWVDVWGLGCRAKSREMGKAEETTG